MLVIKAQYDFMSKLDVQKNSILSLLFFTTFYGFLSFWLVSLISHNIYQIIISLLLIILYSNVFRLYILEIFTIKKTRISEYLNYLLMYLITASIIVLPLIIQPEYVYEVHWVRILIISFASILLIKYFTYMIFGPLHDIIRSVSNYKNYRDKKYSPLVSVVIPAWNEGVGIVNTIDSVVQSNYRNLEIIIVNDGSTDDSDEKIKKYIRSHNRSKNKDVVIKYQYKENGGKGSALNKAIEMASGDIIVSIDADCHIDANAVNSFVEEFKNPKIMAAVGNVKIGNKDSTVGIVQYLEFLFSFYFKRAEALMGSIYIIGGAAGAFRKEVFEKVGNYSTTNITEDIELTVRIQDSGMKIAYVPEASVYTEGASDIQSLKSQRLRWKRGRFQTFYQYRHMFFSLRKKHNKFLSCFVMPLAILSELQLLLEIPFLLFLYSFSIINSDYTSFIVGVVVVGMMFAIQFMFYEKQTRKVSFALLSPIGWLIFYIATYIETYALVKSIYMFITRKQVTWQKWERKGVFQN